MKWREMRPSGNVRDVRGMGGTRGMRGPVAAGGLGLGGLIVLLLASVVLGVNPGDLIGGAPQAPANSSYSATPANDRDVQFVRAVLGDTEDTWARIFRERLGQEYRPAVLVLFSGSVESACGFAQAASGPFYCPRDERLYLDMTFFERIGAAAGPNADFARAYAIAHEVGHHIQGQLGLLNDVRSQQQAAGESTANALQVQVELQADCLAGVWGHYTAQRDLINSQDVESAVNTAAQIGDDYLQQQSQGYVVPESFTHGSSADRVAWFTRGLQTGDVAQCDTFGAGQ